MNASNRGGGGKDGARRRRRRRRGPKRNGEGGRGKQTNGAGGRKTTGGGDASAKTARVENGAGRSGAATKTASNPHSRTTSTTKASLTNVPFDALNVDGSIKKAIRDVLTYEFMTKVQHTSIPVTLTGVDILAKAKTGTGKTLAFLIPAIDRVMKTPEQHRRGKISVLAISPTRELASQIATEAKQLMSCSRIPLSLQVVYGGTNIRTDLSRIARRVPDILIATPGRLNDHLENHGLQRAMSGLRCLIFDEADQLLEMGFRPAITKMLSMLPDKSTRQTLLFSATMPKDVMGIARFALRPSFKHVDCVGRDDVDTHKRIPQFFTVCEAKHVMLELAVAVQEAIAKDPTCYKVMVFFVTARLTGLYSEIFNASKLFDVIEMHSRKSQSYREKSSKRFREGTRGIMFSSDVSARGLDYPDVTRVIQVGVPQDKAQYVHRVGRTGRAGKGGSGLLLLTNGGEQRFLNECKDLGLKERRAAWSPSSDTRIQAAVQRGICSVPYSSLSRGYAAYLGYMKGCLRRLGWKTHHLVDHVNTFATEVCGLPLPPALMKRTIGKMGLRGTPGLRVHGVAGVPREGDGETQRPVFHAARGGGGAVAPPAAPMDVVAETRSYTRPATTSTAAERGRSKRRRRNRQRPRGNGPMSRPSRS
eukprot:g1790.t1